MNIYQIFFYLLPFVDDGLPSFCPSQVREFSEPTGCNTRLRVATIYAPTAADALVLFGIKIPPFRGPLFPPEPSWKTEIDYSWKIENMEAIEREGKQ